MSTTAANTLLDFLRDESHRLQHSLATSAHCPAEPAGLATAAGPLGLRVPLELNGSLWSALVDSINEDRIKLIVDREAVHDLNPRAEATIRYQPENGCMQQTTGRITAFGAVPQNLVALDVSLS